MKLLKNIVLNLILGLNVFILFFLLFEDRIMLPGFLHVLGRMHPLLLHFPIVLLIMALVFEVFSRHIHDQYQPRGRAVGFLLYAGALTAALTVIFGLILSREEGYSGDTVSWHKWTGVAISFFSALILWYHQQQRVNPTLLRAGMGLTCLVLLVAGHLGASLTHGDNFVLEPVMPERREQVDLATAVVFSDLVLPVLEDKCFSCHNNDKSKGELVLTDTASLLAGGKNGAFFVAGDPGKSLVMERLLLEVGHKHHMPPKEKPQPTTDEIGLIGAWIKAGGDFSLRLADLPPSDTLQLLAKAIYGEKEPVKETFAFPAADEALVKKLNTSYRVIAPLAAGSPALDVSFFNSSVFEKASLEELRPIAEQVVNLNLSGMPLTDADMTLVGEFSALRQLNLNYTKITDKGLAALRNQPHLRSLMLTGTPVSASGIDSLLRLPGLNRLYVWNTSITEKEAQKWMKQRPGLVVETGFYDDGSLVLQLNDPEMRPATAFFKDAFDLELSHPISGTALRYTLDGTEPDSLNSPLFKEPLHLTGNTLVKVKAFKKGWKGSDIVELYYHKAAIKPDSARLVSPPDPQYKARGAFSLFDLSSGSLDTRDGKWLGYRGGDLTAVLEFPAPVTLSEVALSALISTGPQIFPPASIEVWGGSSPDNLELLGKKAMEMPGDHQGAQRLIYTCPVDKKELTHLKVVVQPLGKLPSWHPAKGQPAWVFVDEILLN